MLFLRVIVWCGAEKFSLKKSCFYLYIRRRHEPRRNPPADSRRMGTVRTSPQKPYVHQTRNQALLFGVLISAVIETSQLVFMRGLFEWDDMIHNGLGCMVGCLVVDGGV